MFDYVTCQFPLPVDGANAVQYQTKSLNSFMEHYEIRADGTLWLRDYDIEDKTDPAAWRHRLLTGEVLFYTTLTKDISSWIEWSAYFVRGKTDAVHLIRHGEPQAVDAVDPHAPDPGKLTTRANE